MDFCFREIAESSERDELMWGCACVCIECKVTYFGKCEAAFKCRFCSQAIKWRRWSEE